jgi:glyoxylase-like metal-dependent hydrolase (beta-lactamase superfamily II)
MTTMSRSAPGSADPVKAVSVIRTGTVRTHPEQVYRTRQPLYWWLLASRQWTGPRPINAYLVEHARGLVLFDTGQDRLRELSRAELLISAAEWAELADPTPELRGFLRRHILLSGLTWHQVNAERTSDPGLAPFSESLDVIGDGSLMLLPTPGHTAGSMSLLVRRTSSPPLLLAGDLTYGAEILRHGRLPGVGNRRRLAERARSSPSPSTSRIWSSCSPTTRQPLSGDWTAHTGQPTPGNPDGNLRRYPRDGLRPRSTD